MEIRDILLFLHAGASNAAALQIATGLARRHGAAITGCCLCADPAASIADSYAIGYAGAADVLDRRSAKVAAVAEPIKTAFQSAAAEAGVVADWSTPDPNEPPEALALRARFFDLAITARAEVSHHPARRLAEEVALGGGAPCLLAPGAAESAALSRVVVAWNGSAQAKRALDDALPLLKAAAAVQLLVLGDAPGWLEFCSPEQMVRRLARHDVDAELRITPRDGEGHGGDLAAACAAFDADLLVMGAYSHARGGEVLFGGATRDVLAEFAIPVLMSR